MSDTRIFSSEKGFTLVEVLIVVALLGILISFVVPNVIGFLSTAKEVAFTADKRIIQVAVDAYYIISMPHALPTDSGLGGPINFTYLVTSVRILREVPRSAVPAQGGEGHYLWQVDDSGIVTNTFAGDYP